MTASEARLRSVPWRALDGLAPALEAPLEAVLGGRPAERVLDRLLRDLRDVDRDGRAAVAEAVFGVGLWRRRLGFHAGIAPQHLTAPSPQPSPPLGEREKVASPLLAALLRDLGGLGTEEAERIAGVEAGTLAPPRPPPPELALRYSLPDWLAETLVREVGAEAEALADALNLPGPICLRPNLLRTTASGLAARLEREGVGTRGGELVPTSLVVTSPRPNVYGLPAHREGLCEVQDEGSQLLGELVGARAGEEVLDLCAGAGGKALQLAAAVGGAGAVHAFDSDLERLDRLERRAARAGASGIVRIHREAPPRRLLVDRALVDAPCSELGALRRGPDARFRLDPGSFAPLPALQLALLARAADHVRPGGRLVYGTCTFRREEDEEVATAFEASHPDFVRLGAGAALERSGFVRTWPHRHGCDGFFAAVWRRLAGEEEKRSGR